MKKLITLLFAVIIANVAMAQTGDNGDPFRSAEFMRMILTSAAIILSIYFIADFLLRITRMILDYKLKNKMMQKEVSDAMLTQFLAAEKKDSRTTAVKWAIIIAGVGLGFLLMKIFPPFGIHSVMLMSFCISLSFLCYHQYSRNQAGKQ